ncbi:hypothetical protein AHAS_Ahas05G0062500 [Arachis hypogaea]
MILGLSSNGMLVSGLTISSYNLLVDKCTDQNMLAEPHMRHSNNQKSFPLLFALPIILCGNSPCN